MVNKIKNPSKVLILTCKFGAGHYSVAQTIKKEILKNSPKSTVIVVDMVEYLHPRVYRSIYHIFNNIICRSANVYNFVNSFGTSENEDTKKRSRITQIEKLIRTHNPDTIISTWSACTRYVSEYKRASYCPIPLYTYITDMSVHNGWVSEQVDRYFVATEDVKSMLVKCKIAKERITVGGIPVRDAFKTAVPVSEEHRNKHLLVMGGGLGIIPWISKLLLKLAYWPDISITVITGKNKRLYRYIKKNYPKVEVLGYTPCVHKYMKQADLLITKPGGVTVFEAIYTMTPLLILNPQFSQEIDNAQFIEKSGIGKVLWDINGQFTSDIIDILRNHKELEKIKNSMYEFRIHLDKDNFYTINEGGR